MKKYVETVLFPKICADGGWVEFVSISGNELTLRFKGECAKCLILHRCTDWIESEIRRDLHKKIKVTAIKKNPYFQEI